MSKMEHDGLTIQHLPTQEELDAFVHIMDNCFIDTADYDTMDEMLTELKKRIEDYDEEDTDE